MVVDLFEAQVKFSELIDRVLDGEKVIIMKFKKPVVELIKHVEVVEKEGNVKGKVLLMSDL